MSKQLKRMLASQLEGALEESNGLMLIDQGSMTVETNQAFRRDLREQAGGARVRLLHNRTAKIALRSKWGEEGFEALDDLLKGPNSIVYGGEGPIAIAKVVRDWKKKHKPLELKAAVADGELLQGPDAEALADMPDLTQLKGMLLGAILGAPRGIAVSLSAVYGGIARCLQARIDESGESGESEAAE